MANTCHAQLVLAIAVLTNATGACAELKVMVSGGFASASEEIVPQFEKNTGAKVSTSRGASQGTGPNTIGAQLRRGVSADVVIMSREGLNDLIAEGRIQAGTDIDLAQTPLGVSVRAGAARPDISTVEAFKRTLLSAKSITFPGSTTGIWMTTKLFPQLGIAKQLEGKITNTGVAAIEKGDAEIAIQPVSELLHVPGTDYVGTMPAEIQYISVFSGAIVSGTREPELAKRFLAFLRSESGMNAIQRSGMDPPRPLH
jgi:molybdate transport system substrate-binding protein